MILSLSPLAVAVATAVLGSSWQVKAIGRNGAGLLLVQRRVDRKDTPADEGRRVPEALWNGSTAPLTEEGYRHVAALKKNQDMTSFVKRVFYSMDLLVVDETKLNFMVPSYSGVASEHDFDSLRTELLGATWAIGGTGWTSPLTDEGYRKVFTSGATAPRRAFARRILYEHGDVVFCCDDEMDELLWKDWQSNQFKSLNAQLKSLPQLVKLARNHPEASSGKTAPLSDTGYQFVTLARSNVEMKHFIGRLAESEGLVILDDAKLSGLVPFYSGAMATQDLKALLDELRAATWVRKAN